MDEHEISILKGSLAREREQNLKPGNIGIWTNLFRFKGVAKLLTDYRKGSLEP